MKNNIVLIGMPGAGKSTIGVVLAKTLGMQFVDTDLTIQNEYDATLQKIIQKYGDDGFRKIENDVISKVNVSKTVIATGGSAVYGNEAMEHLKESATIVYLELSEKNIESRLGDLAARGITMKSGQTLEDLYTERVPLYKKYADITINCDGKNIQQSIELCIKLLTKE